MLATITRKALDYREVRSITRNKTRMERDMAEPYTMYWRRAQAAFPVHPTLDPLTAHAVEQFACDGVASFWTEETHRLAAAMFQRMQEEERRNPAVWKDNPEYNSANYTSPLYPGFPEIEQLFRGALGAFLQGVYQTSFKIFYGVLFRSEHLTDAPAGSQLWHDDGGPGTCINVLVYLRDVTVEDGAWCGLPWGASFEIYKRALPEMRRRLREALASGPHSKEALRELRCRYYEEEIERAYIDQIIQPVGQAGLIVPFRNNVIHRGGYPQTGHTRYVCIFHCYPSDKPVPFDRYRQLDIPKRTGVPADPAADF